MGLMDVLYDLLLNFVEKYDAKRGIPRPVSHPDLTARQAALRCLMTAAKMFWLMLCGSIAAYLMLASADLFDVERDTRFILICGSGLVLLFSTAKALQALLPYEREEPPVAQAPSLWADPAWLRSAGFAQEYGTYRRPGELRLGTLPTGYQLVLPAANTMRHIALFGPKGSGKSAAFICTFLRDWARHGSTIALDPKGELFEQTASLYQRVYRLDLIDPTRSDYWTFVPDCKDNARLASEIASIIVASQPDARHSGSHSFGIETEAPALTAILLHLPHIVEQPTPAMISEFISVRSIDPLEGETESPLNKEMSESPDPQVGKYWKDFARVDRYRQGVILSDLISKCRMFTSPAVKAVTSSLATPGSASRAAIDLNMLHTPGTAIYLRILEAQADLYGCFLTAFFRLVLSTLSAPPRSAAEYAPGLFVFDEAGSIPIRGLTSMLNLAPCSEVAIVAAFQHVGQIYDHYGPLVGDAVLRSLKTMVFLPGLDQRTTEFGARLAGFNAIQHGAIDERSKKRKGVRLAGDKHVYLYEQELCQLDRHKRAIAVVGDAPPIKFLLAPLVQAYPEEISGTANKGAPYVIDFQTAEAQYKRVDIEDSTGVRKNPCWHAELFQPPTSPADEIEEERTQRRPRDPTADDQALEV
jgi:type IV secretory pathway TraG/TraD family ATPase VirD4